MKCERCGKDEAVVKLTRIEKGGHPYQVCLCQSCAGESSPYQKKAMEKQQSFDMLLKELLKNQTSEAAGVAEDEAEAPVGPCPSCGLTWHAYKATYMLGCPDCYESFAELLDEDLERIHRARRHVADDKEQNGKNDHARTQEKLASLRDELKSAVEYEDFERAVQLRDMIAQIEQELTRTS